MAYNVKTIVERETMKYEMVRDHAINMFEPGTTAREIMELHYSGQPISAICKTVEAAEPLVRSTVIYVWKNMKRDAAFWKAVDAI